MGHGHSHAPEDFPRAAPVVRRRLAAAVSPFVVATLIGLVWLWPGAETPALGGTPADIFKATVTDIEPTDCGDLPSAGAFDCADVMVRLDEGPDEGEVVSFQAAQGEGGRHYAAGDKVLMSRAPESPPEVAYNFFDYQRGNALLVLALLFAVVVVLLSRWKGLSALVGLAVSLIVLIRFVLPAILAGDPPIAVAIVGSAAIMFVSLYLAHGLNARTTTAVIGTMASLALTGALAYFFVDFARFTGFGSEEALFLQVSAQQVNLQGLLLGGIIIGTLGVLDDVTVTQASAVWELHVANPMYSVRRLYRAAVRIGHDHIASTVNTLVLAYAGASLPLLILFVLSERPLGQLVTTEVVAEEIVRTLVGSIGLVASVPITTALAAIVVRAGRDGAPADGADHDHDHVEEERASARPGYRRPKAEEEWRRPLDER
ncbi:MAG TPA: YibE/F family protein [Actinomycetota bacterium]|nr:YibE/F family protein [Actinomycetota bacterium]